jgi:transketolase
LFGPDHRFQIGKGQQIHEGHDVSIVACGVEVARALDAAEILARDNISARVINMPTIKPIDTEILVKASNETGCIVTAEDHNILGGLGGAVAETIVQNAPCPIEFVGVRDVFGQSGEPGELAQHYRLTGPFIADAARKAIARKKAFRR